MIFKFNQFIKEELRISTLDNKTLDVLKQNLKETLIEYKTYLLSNIEIKDGKVIFKDFDRVEERTIISQLNNEFTKELIEELKVEELIEKVGDLYRSKNPLIKKQIRKDFTKYFKYLETVQK